MARGQQSAGEQDDQTLASANECDATASVEWAHGTPSAKRERPLCLLVHVKLGRC